MKLRFPTKAEVVSVICVAAWVYWLTWSDQLTKQVYLLNNNLIYGVVIIAAILAAFLTWRVSLRQKETPGRRGKFKSVSAIFFALFIYLALSLWHIPELIMVATAHQHVSGTYKFRMAYPGPSCGKHCRCKAGVIYYDTYLKREIEFCHWDDASSFFYTDSMRVDKIISEQGGKVISHEAIH